MYFHGAMPVGNPARMDERLHALAASRGGYITRGEILDCGYHDRDIAAGVRSGDLARVRTGVYAPGAVYGALDQNGQHLVAARSVVDKLHPNVAMSHATGCATHGLAQFDVDLGTVHVTRLDGASG